MLVVVAGCDTVFQLTVPPDAPPIPDANIGHDEDMDGIGDGADLCPHLANGIEDDDDQDGIGDRCDPFPGDANNRSWFVSFHEGDTFKNGALLRNGAFVQDGDDILFGTLQPDARETMLLPDGTNALRVTEGEIVVEATIVEPVPDNSFHEFAAVFVSQTTDNADRGDLCFAGYSSGSPTYLELVENENQKGYNNSSQAFRGNRARLVMTRSNTNVSCTLTANGVNLTGTFTPAVTTAGRIGVLTANSRTRFHYLWIVTRP